MKLDDIYLILSACQSEYANNNVATRLVKNKVKEYKDFNHRDMDFNFINGEYQVTYTNKIYDDLYELFNDHYMLNANEYIKQYLDLPDIIKNNDIELLLKFMILRNGDAYKNVSSKNSDYYDFGDDVDIVNIRRDISYRLPFVLYVNDINGTSQTIGLNNIDGVYKIIDLNAFITNEDEIYLKQAAVMESI